MYTKYDIRHVDPRFPVFDVLIFPYAQTLIVVVLIVVNKFGFLVITRDHGSFGGRHQVEILPTDLPELFKPARDLLEPRKFENLGPNFSS